MAIEKKLEARPDNFICNFLMQGQVIMGPENYESTHQTTYIYEIKSGVQRKPGKGPTGTPIRS